MGHDGGYKGKYKLDDEICVIRWCIEDLLCEMERQGIEQTDENIDMILSNRFERTLDERSTEEGWEIIADLVWSANWEKRKMMEDQQRRWNWERRVKKQGEAYRQLIANGEAELVMDYTALFEFADQGNGWYYCFDTGEHFEKDESGQWWVNKYGGGERGPFNSLDHAAECSHEFFKNLGLMD